jgi:cysteine-rich repeat protein
MISKFFTKSILSSLFLSVALGVTACGQNNPTDNEEEDVECGNGTLEEGEQCDDGDTSDGDGCSSACEIEEGPSEAEQIDAYVEGLGTLNNPEPLAETAEGDAVDSSYGPYKCETQNFRQVKVIDAFKLQGGALQERIFPGMLLSGASLASGNFDEVIIAKKPLKLSHDVVQLPIAATELTDPSLGNFAQARTNLLVAQLGDQTFEPQATDARPETTINKDELSLQLGFDVSAGIATEVDVVSSFSFDNTDTQSRYVIKITNELYTMKIDPVSFASDFFADGVTLQQVQSLFQFGAPPVYVDTVTYGRDIFVTVESFFSEQELKLALDVAVANDALQFDSNLDFGLTTNQVLDQTTIVGIAVGGIDGDSVDISSLSGTNRAAALASLVARKVVLSKDSLGQPISFTTRYLPSIFGNANSVVDASYSRENCERLAVDFDVEVDRINVTVIADGNDNDTTAEIRGTIKVISGQDSVDIFRRNVGQEVSFTRGSFTPSQKPFLSGRLDNVDTTFNVENKITVEFSLTEDDGRTGGSNGNGEVDSEDDVSLIIRQIPIADLYKNGGQVPVEVPSAGGMGFTLFLNFTPNVGLIPVP